MNLNKKIRVLLVDDHAAVLVGLRACLKNEDDIEIVAEAADGVEAVNKYRTFLPDITLMDLCMPKMCGVDAIREICKDFPKACIIVFSTRQGDADIHRAIKFGARSYVTKNLPIDEILTAIRSLHAGRNYFPPEVKDILESYSTHAELTRRELEVLTLLSEGGSNKEIADKLCIAEITVKKHMSQIFSKLEVLDRNQAVVAALRRGIVNLDEF